MQERLEEIEGDEVHIAYREIKSENDLDHTPKTEEDKIEQIESLINDVARKTGTHKLDELDCSKNIPKWAGHLISNFPDYNEDYVEFIVEDFSQKMNTSAKGPGKYAVVVLRENGFLVCHADSGEKTLSTSLEVIDRLMDSDNIDKFAEFYNQDGEIFVDHYERNRTEGFTEWLGIPRNEVVFDTIGNIKGYTELEGLTAIFEFDEDDITEKIIESEEYELVEGVLRTPEGNEYPLDQIKWGRQKFESTEKFKQKLTTLYYELDTYHEKFVDLHGSSRPYFNKFIDKQEKLVEDSTGETEIPKRNENFQISFSSRQIDTDAAWLASLANDFLEGNPTGIYHASTSAVEIPYNIGPFSFFNELDINTYNLEKLENLYSVVDGVGTGNNLQRIVGSSIFLILDELTESKCRYLFQELSEKMMSRVTEGVVLQREGEPHGLEFKAREWLGDKSVEEISEEMIGELEGETNLLIIGIDEEEHLINPIKSTNLKSEFREKIEQETELADGTNIEAVPLPVSSKEVLLVCFKNGDSAIETAALMDVISAPAGE